MCGRYTITRAAAAVARAMNREIMGHVSLPVYNASPGQDLPVVLDCEPRRIVSACWGFRPMRGRLAGRMLINARAETVHERPMFRDSFLHRRCLVVADGFYEWKSGPRGKQPFRITLADDSVFTFAGIWMESAGEKAYVILTTDANKVTRPIHERMPVILEKQEQDLWLDHSLRPGQVRELLDPYPEDEMRAYRVSRAVNDSRNERAALIVPVGDEGDSEQEEENE